MASTLSKGTADAGAAGEGVQLGPAGPSRSTPDAGFYRRPCNVIDDYRVAVLSLGPCPGKRTRWKIGFKQGPVELRVKTEADLKRLFAPDNLTWKPRKTVQPAKLTRPDGATYQTGVSTYQTKMAHKDIYTKGEENPSPSGMDSAAQATAPLAGATEGGERVGGRVPDLRGYLVGSSVPPYPTVDLVQPVRVPGFPKLQPEWTDVEKVTALVKAYRAVVRHKYGDVKQIWVYARGVTPKSKNFKALLNRAEELLEGGISPHGWTLFSVENWIGQGKPKPPTIGYVFAQSRIQRQAGWYRSRSGEFAEATVRMAPLHRLLLRTWSAMQAALVRKQPATVQATEAIVEKFFPPGTWEARLDMARKEAQAMEQDLKARMDAGYWIW